MVFRGEKGISAWRSVFSKDIRRQCFGKTISSHIAFEDATRSVRGTSDADTELI